MIEFAAQQLGGEVAWMCEIEPFCVEVLNKRFLGVPVFSDVKEVMPWVKLYGHVDVLVGGFP